MENPQHKFQRVHPLSLIIYLSGSILSLVLLFFTFESFQNPVLLLAYFLLASWVILPRYVFFRYSVNSQEIIIHKGVFNRIRRNIPSDRIQNVAIERNIISRILGLAAVKIETAGSTKAEGVLAYVRLQEAHRIHALLRSSEPLEENTTSATLIPDFAMSFKQVLLSGMYTFTLLYFAVAASIFGQFEQFGFIDTEEFLMSITDGQLNNIVEQSLRSPILLIIPIVFGGLLLGWVTGIVVHVIRYYGFRLELRPKKIHRRLGLFTLRETTIPYTRVQTLVIRSNPLMRLHNWFRLELQTLAFESDDEGRQMTVPFAQKSTLLSIAQRIHPFTLPETFHPVSPVSIRRMGLRYSLALIVLVIALNFVWEPALWGVVLLPLLWGLAWLQYRCHEWAFEDANLYVRRGVFWQRLWVVPAKRFQALQTSATLFQRRLGVCQLTVDTAGAGILRYPRIVDIPIETAEKLTQILYNAFRAEIALLRKADSKGTVEQQPNQTDPSSCERDREEIRTD